MVQEWLVTTQSRQKSYTEKRQSDLKFKVRDYVLEGLTMERGDSVSLEWKVGALVYRSVQGNLSSREISVSL